MEALESNGATVTHHHAVGRDHMHGIARSNRRSSGPRSPPVAVRWTPPDREEPGRPGAEPMMRFVAGCLAAVSLAVVTGCSTTTGPLPAESSPSGSPTVSVDPVTVIPRSGVIYLRA